MSTTDTSQNQSQPATPKSPVSRRRKKTEGRKKRALKLKTNKDFAKQFFEAKSKRATDKKAAFRKKKSKKK